MDEQEFWAFQTRVVNELNNYREQKDREIQELMTAIFCFVASNETEQKEIVKELKHILSTGATFDAMTFKEIVFKERK